MAIDTQHKRWSLLGCLFPPDGSIDANDRLSLLDLYSGLTLAEEVSVTLGFADIPQPGDAAFTWEENFSSILEDMCTYVEAISSLSSEDMAQIDLSSATSNQTEGGTLGAARNVYRVSGQGGPVTLNDIADGTVSGQLLCVIGTSDSNTVTIADGSNTAQNSDITLGSGDIIMYVWDGTGGNWTELYRNQ